MSGLLPLVERGLYDVLPQRGIVHVGANSGQELQWYIDRGMVPILCFEPNPQAFVRAMSTWEGHADVGFVRLALGDFDGEIDMNIPEDGDDEKTSRYEPIPTPGHAWTAVAVKDRIRTPVQRFDSWIRQHSVNFDQFGTLVVDVQGMELEVLDGFGVYLQEFRYLCIELSEKPVYDGEATADEVVGFLAAHGFKQETPTVEHGDVLFSRT